MKTTTARPDAGIGARFTIFLIPLFIAALLAMLGLVYPVLIGSALDACGKEAPLANPALVISSDIGTSDADAQTLSLLSDIGTVIPVICSDTETADGLRIRLIAADSDAIADAFWLCEGRMPQNEGECVIVSQSPAVTGKTVGAVLRIHGTDDEALTVVGIGENLLSVLAPITEPDTQLLVYTVNDRLADDPTAATHLYLTDCKSEDPVAAVSSVYTQTAETRTALRVSREKERLQACELAAQQADSAVTAQEIVVLATENRLDTANLRVAEAEANMMDAVAALQAEKQEFVSDMEYNEYYALRQVDLIPRRDRAEEGYAKQEAVISQMNTDLHTAYADRDALAAALAQEKERLTELYTAADLAMTAMEQQQIITAQSGTVQSPRITTADQHPGYRQLQAHAAHVRDIALLLSVLALGIYLVGSLTVYAVSRRVCCPPARFLLCAACITLPAILIGAYLPARPIFVYSYPALRTSLTLPSPTAQALPIGAAVLLGSIAVSVIITVIGHRISRIHRTHTGT